MEIVAHAILKQSFLFRGFMNLSELQQLRLQLESAVPGFSVWPEVQRLYGPAADFTPEASVESVAAQMNWGRPESAGVLQVLLPHLTSRALDHVMNFAARTSKVELLAIGWESSSQSTRLNVLRSSAWSQDTDLLDWVLVKMDPTQPELQEALLSAVWQGSEITVARLIPLVEEPWRIIEQLRKKGDPARLLAKLDECWASALDEENASVPDGRVLTPKFRDSLPKVSLRATHHRLSKRLKPASAAPARPRLRF